MKDLLAMVTIMVWPVVPLFWIPVHGLSRFFKRIGILTYLLPSITWPPIAFFIYQNRDFFLQFKLDFPVIINIIGIILLIIGTILHIWTGKLLGLFGLMGLPEISKKKEGRLITEEIFSFVRHPTYLAHTILFTGIFLYTEVLFVGILTITDLIIVNILIIPLEEKELLGRFGEAYNEYKKKVKWRFIPKII